MDIQQLYEFCLSKKEVTEHFPFDADTLVFKVGGKMFCMASLQEWEKGNPAISVKCDPEKNEELRAEYEAVNPGFHMNKTYWNTVDFNSDVNDKMICELINHSYDLVYKSLPKKLRDEIEKS